MFRQPVQTMMSHLDPQKGGGAGGAPCLRSKRSPSPEVLRALALPGVTPSNKASNEAWCAAHLSMLCSHALDAYSIYNRTDGEEGRRPRGLLLNYDALPGIVPRALMPLFGQQLDATALERMHLASQPYSKGRGMKKEAKFKGDSGDKEARAPEALRSMAELMLQPSYEQLDQLARHAFQEITADLSMLAENGQSEAGWTAVKKFPPPTERQLKGAGLNGGRVADPPHSNVLREEEFLAWSPFANHHSSQPFRRADCPPIPPSSYPETYPMVDILGNWNSDVTEIPPVHFDSLCHFDYQNASQRAAALAYREREVPFITYNVPEVDDVVRKWNDLSYLSKLLGSKAYRTETSKDNHFMYWSGGRKTSLRNWQPPTEVVSERFKDWLEIAVRGQNQTLESRKHEYFRVSSDSNNEWLYDELPFFKPQKSLFIVEPREQRGIHCRFGMRSVISEAHFDGSRNSVAMLGGLRRWILTHPDQCKNMHMLQRPHPSARHSAVDWSQPDLEKFPNFRKVRGNEVILRPGDVLFVPTVWVHYIVSLNVNFQCNTRSGIFHGYDKHIHECGF